MMSLPACSLIVSTYNWPQALELTLKSILRQTHLPQEVIIADDGSTEETASLIRAYQPSFPVPLIHLWQEDQGFRLATIRNKAFAASAQPYIIQIDGDILLHARFVEDHLRMAEPNALLQGSRVMLGPSRSQQLLRSRTPLVSMLNGDIKRRENGIRWMALAKYLATRYRNRYPVYYARGANMSFWKKDLLEVNGYNENFQGWGHEDSDLTLRLLNRGKKKRILKFCAIAYHLYHPENASKLKEEENKRLLEETRQHQTIWTNRGLNQYLKHD